MASAEDRILRLAHKVMCAPLARYVDTTAATPSLTPEGKKQLAMARTLGRVTLRAAQAPRSPAATAAKPAKESAHVNGSIAGYEELTAREIIALVKNADRATARWIRAAEEQGKQRVTVLRALDNRDVANG